jgi:hypothetical protein
VEGQIRKEACDLTIAGLFRICQLQLLRSDKRDVSSLLALFILFLILLLFAEGIGVLARPISCPFN